MGDGRRGEKDRREERGMEERRITNGRRWRQRELEGEESDGKREGGRDGWREERKKVAFHCRPRLIGIISPPQSERSDCR